MTSRRWFLLSGAAFLSAVAIRGFMPNTLAQETGETFAVNHTPEQWKAKLTVEQYRILREADTEKPFTSALEHEKRQGIFRCAGCDLPVYSSEAKFDSGTGWPSFWEALPGGIATREDDSFFMTRTECHCSRCGGHLGHIFDDGPAPTGKRHCINGFAMLFSKIAA